MAMRLLCMAVRRPGMEKVQDFRKLKVWQIAMDLTVQTYDVTSQLPASEGFGLQSQARRSAVSIASNIAEGTARDSDADFCRFLRISLGSLAELQTQVELMSRLGLVESSSAQRLLLDAEDLGIRLRNFTKRLQSNAQPLPSKAQQ